MKKIFFLLVFVIVTGLISCNNDNRPETITGTWEYSYQNEDNDHVNQYVFKSDGTFTHASLIRNTESGEEIGYNYWAEGTFRLNGDDYSEVVSKRLLMPSGSEEPVLPKEELVEYNGSGNIYRNEGTLIIKSGGNQFELDWPCNDMVFSSSSICIGALTYDKVD